MKKTALEATAVEAKLRKLNGNMAAVARALGVHRSTVKRFIDKRPSLQETMLDLREAMKDNAESALYSAVLAGHSWAVQFYLRTQAKERGYSERTELRHGIELEIVETLISSPEEAAQAVSDRADAGAA